MAVQSFKKLIGEIVSGCGTLELIVNGLINILGKDPILAREITALGFERRVKVLRRLMLDRTSLPPDEVKSLSDDLLRIARERNKVAHNPIVAEDRGANPHIFVIGDFSDIAISRELYESHLKEILAQVSKVQMKIGKCVPEIVPRSPIP